MSDHTMVDAGMIAEVLDLLGPVAVMSALRDCDDTIVDFRYDLVNPAFCEVLGEPAEVLVGARLLELYPSHLELGLFDAFRRVVDAGEPFVGELPWFDERNVRAFFEVSVTPFRDGYLMTGRDVTAEKMGRQVQQIFDSSHDGIVSVDEQLRVTAWNTGAATLHGVEEDVAVGEHLGVFVPDDARSGELARLQQVLADGEVLEPFTSVRLHRDGSVHPVEVSAAPILAPDGSIAGVSLVHRSLDTRPSAADPERSAASAVAAGAESLPSEVEVWCRSTGRWVPGFRFEGLQPDGSVLVRRVTDRSALPQSLPRASVRPARSAGRRAW